jgi:hypothetical protein
MAYNEWSGSKIDPFGNNQALFSNGFLALLHSAVVSPQWLVELQGAGGIQAQSTTTSTVGCEWRLRWGEGVLAPPFVFSHVLIQLHIYMCTIVHAATALGCFHPPCVPPSCLSTRSDANVHRKHVPA